MDEETTTWLKDIAENARRHLFKSPIEAVEYIQSQGLHADERVALNALFDSKERAAMKKAVTESQLKEAA